MTDLESDDEDLEIITYSDEGEEAQARPRPIRPLRKSGRNVPASANIPIGAGSFNASNGEGIFDVPFTHIKNEDRMDTF